MLYAPSFFALFHQEIAFPGKPKSDTLGTPPCTAVKKTKSYDFVQHQKPGTCFLMQASATTPIYCPDVWIFVLHGYVCVLLTSKTDTFLLCM